MDAKMEELKIDLAELEALQKGAARQRTKNVLDLEIRKITGEILNLEQAKLQAGPVSSTTKSDQQRYLVKVNNYAWDQSDKFVKFYVTLKNVQVAPAENVFCKFTDKALELHVKDLENKDYYFTITNLLHKINPEQSTWKVKTDMVIINAAKVEQTQWSHVTQFEKKASDSKKLDTDNEKLENDPSAGIMNLMKKMYDQGDDEMKRTIAKAWTESQNKIHETRPFD